MPAPETVAPRTSRTEATFDHRVNDMALRTPCASDESRSSNGGLARDKLNDRAGRGFDQGRRDDGIRAGENETASEQADVRSQPEPAKPVAESFAPPRLAALDRAERPAQMPGRLLVAASLEIAEDQRAPR